MKTVYLDVCALYRPYDDQAYARIHLETTAVRLILRAVEKDVYKMVYSPIHFWGQVARSLRPARACFY